MSSLIGALATHLDDARRTGLAVPQLSLEHKLDLDDAYAIQRNGVQLRLDAGERVVGAKLGFTSKAKAEQMGVSDVIVGTLTSAMAVEDGSSVDLSGCLHPRVEPEVAFLLRPDVDFARAGVDLLRYATHVAVALEIIDSRYQDFQFNLADVVADNTSASHFVIGGWTALNVAAERPKLTNLRVEMSFGDEVVATGSTADILGDPLEALPTLGRLAAHHGHVIPVGAVVLAGAATSAVPVSPGVRVSARIDGLGSASVRTAKGQGHA